MIEQKPKKHLLWNKKPHVSKGHSDKKHYFNRKYERTFRYIRPGFK